MWLYNGFGLFFSFIPVTVELLSYVGSVYLFCIIPTAAGTSAKGVRICVI